VAAEQKKVNNLKEMIYLPADGRIAGGGHVEIDLAPEVLLESFDARVAILTLNRPGSLNALNDELMCKLAEAIALVAQNDAIRCVVLTGSGRGFCAGGDRREMAKGAQQRAESGQQDQSNVERRSRWLRRSVEAARLLFEMPKISIAMINGACAGAGLSLAAACDFRFAAASAKFVPAFVANGLPGDYGGSWLWTHILGVAKARQLYLLGESRNAQEALAFGLVDRVYEDSALREQTLKLAHQVAELSPTAVASAKANLNAAPSETFAQSLNRESLNMMLGREALEDLATDPPAQE
jgi:2-(1,2-epoxy-1,2-dihydrophenyl)acetyl-CoA isomerase